jgi:hypothetical protein
MYQDIGDKMSPTHKIEKLGLEVLHNILSRFGRKLNAPRRQNETVDSFIKKTDGTMVAISHKTASICNKDPKQRAFQLHAAPNTTFATLSSHGIQICLRNLQSFLQLWFIPMVSKLRISGTKIL